MKTNYYLLTVFLVCANLSANEPNEGGIGGTGRGESPPNIDAFETPDVLDGLDVPLPTDQIPDLPDDGDLGFPRTNDIDTPDETPVPDKDHSP